MLINMFIALLGVLVSSTTASTPADRSRSILPRWYGTTLNFQGIGPWPVTEVSPSSGNQQPLLYCYADTGSANNLQPIVQQAIQKWQPAFQHSALSIILDPGCRGDQYCHCDDLPEPVDALVIQDLGPLPEDYNGCEDTVSDCTDQSEGNDKEDGSGPDNPEILVQQTRTTVGYEYDSIASERHYLRFLGYDHDRASIPTVWNKWVLEIAHELGHALGLGYEHQRPDRDGYVLFVCVALVGYDEAKTRVQQALNNGEIPDCVNNGSPIDIDDCMDDHICENYDLAREYFPNAAASYISGDQIVGFDGWVMSYPFDWQSIMIYGSYQSASDDDEDFPAGAVLQGKVQGAGENFFEFYQGGNVDPANAGNSAGDIARIAQLYDKGTQDGTTAMNLATWSQQLAGGQKRTAAPSTLALMTVAA